MTTLIRRLVAIAFLTLPGVLTLSSSSAYWAAGGMGSAGTGSTQPVTLGPATVVAGLYPGGQTQTAVTVTNPNPGPVRIGSLLLDPTQGQGGFGVDAGHVACGLTTLTFASQTNGGSGWNIPGGDSVSIILPDSLSMGLDAASVCQGAAFSVYLRVGS